MTPNRPYLIRAFYDWIVDNRLTPYVAVNANYAHVDVPEDFVEDGKIVLNLAPQAIKELSMGNHAVEFDANFSGHITHLYLPIPSITAIYAHENGRGMIFTEEEEDSDGGNDEQPPPRPKGPPKLRVVK